MRRTAYLLVMVLTATLLMPLSLPAASAADTIDPTVSITSPEDGHLFDAHVITVTWAGTDPGENASGIVEYRINVDFGDWMIVHLSTSYTFNYLSEGMHTVQVLALDDSGNEASDTVSFNIDTLLPTIEILSPTSGSVFDTDSVQMTWDGSDANSGIGTYEIWINGQEVYDLGNVEAFLVTPLTDGDYTIEVRAYDRAGNMRSDSVELTVDTMAPSIDIISPHQNELYSTEVVAITWEADDDGSGVENCEMLIDGSTIYVGKQTGFQTPPLSNGYHTATVIAEDLVGHSASASVTFNIDTIAPDLVILNPSEGDIIGDSSLYISVMAEDENSGIDHFEIEVDSLGAIDMGSSSGIVLPPLSYGQHNIAITVLDRAGNHATEEVNITLTNVAPDVAIILSGNVFNSSSVTIEWTSDGSEAPIDHFEVDVDSIGWTDVGDSSSISLSDLEEGEHIFMVRAHDVAGNIAMDICTFTVDSLAPVIGFTAPGDMQAFPSSDVTLSWQGEDATTWITGYWVSIDDSSWLPMGTTSSLDLPRLSAGQHTASLRAVDHAGNEATDSVTFFIDTTAPEISMLRFNGTNATGAFMIEWECSEAEVLFYECSIDSSEWMVVNGTNISLELDAGTHTFSIRATDPAGNLGDGREIGFSTDMLPPILISASPEGDSVQPDSIMLLIFSEPMDPASVEITGIQGTISVDGSTVLFTPASVLAANTTYHVTVNGNDLGGNPMATEEWDFTTAVDVGSESGTEEEGMHWAVYFGIGAVIGVLAFLIVGMSIIKLKQRRGLID